MTVTIKTIAEKVNLSNQAVSAALNNKTNCRVSPKNRELILQAARKLGYTSSISAQVIRGKTTKTVALLCSSSYIQTDEHLTRIILELMNRFNASGYGCLYSLATPDAGSNLKMVRELISRGATAFVFLGEPIGRGKLEEFIKSFGHTVISYGVSRSSRYVESFMGEGIKEVIDYFLACGHERIQVIFRGRRRLTALYGAFPGMTEKEVDARFLFKNPVPESWETNLEVYMKNGYEATRKLLKQKPDTNAIFYHSDIFALGGIRYLLEKNYRIGTDILVAGINNTLAIRCHVMPISSLEHNVSELTSHIMTEVFRENKCRIEVPMIAHIRTAAGNNIRSQTTNTKKGNDL